MVEVERIFVVVVARTKSASQLLKSGSKLAAISSFYLIGVLILAVCSLARLPFVG